MKFARFTRRAGALRWSWLVVSCLALGLPGGAGAQVPDTVPADTAGVDTVRVPVPPDAAPRDTIVAADSVARDSAVPVPPFPRYARPARDGFAFGRWEWDRQELLRYHSLSLLQLLERVPGISAIRTGDFGQPAGLATLGGAGSRVRVFLDGFELSPLGFTSFDVQQIALGDLESVRVERGVDGIRIDLTPMRLPDARPLSGVEAATGVYDTKLLRALLMRGIGRRMILTAAFDQASSQGVGFDEPFSYSAARASLSYAFAPGTAVQAEYRTESAESGEGAVPLEANRRTVLLRGRSELLPGLVVDGMIGRTTRRPEEADSIDIELASTQGALRAAFDIGRLWLEGSARMQSEADALGRAGTQLEARAGTMVLPWLLAEGEIRTGAILGASGTGGSGTVRLGPLAGLSGFATVGFGEQALALVRDTSVAPPVVIPREAEELHREPRFSAVSSSAAALRVGGDWTLPSGTIGAAAVLLPEGVSAPFGHFGLDRGRPSIDVETGSGLEAYASLPVPFTREYLRVEGWYTWWSTLGGRPYVPEDEGRVALEAHGIFYGGDLEPSLRVEGVRRGSMLAMDDTGALVPTAAYNMGNLQLEIRILDVRAFLAFDNFTNIRTAADIPGRFLPGSKLYYGLRWTFRN